MAFQTVTYTDEKDLLNYINLFLTSNGFTLIQYADGTDQTTDMHGFKSPEGSGYIPVRLVLSKDGTYFNFISTSYGKPFEVYQSINEYSRGICMNLSNGHSGFLDKWDDQPGGIKTGTQSSGVKLSNTYSSGTAYMFSWDSGDSFAIIAEREPGRYSGLFYEKISNDLRVISGMGYAEDDLKDEGLKNAGIMLQNGSSESSLYCYNKTTGDTVSSQGNHYSVTDASYRTDSFWGTGGATNYISFALIVASQNSYTNTQVLQPAYYCLKQPSQTYYEVYNFKNIRVFATDADVDQQEKTYGSDVWKYFKMIVNDSTNQIGYSGNTTYIAFKKVT